MQPADAVDSAAELHPGDGDVGSNAGSFYLDRGANFGVEGGGGSGQRRRQLGVNGGTAVSRMCPENRRNPAETLIEVGG